MDFDETLSQIVNRAQELLQADAAIAYLLNDEETHLNLGAISGISENELKHKSLALSNCPLDQETLKGNRIIISNTAHDPLAVNLPGSFRSVICVPLADTAEPIGTLHVYAAKPGYFTEKDAIQLKSLAAIGTSSFEISKEIKELNDLRNSRDRFIHIATHELRSPVTVAQSLVRGVLKGYAGEMTEKQEDTFSRISRNLDFLENLVNDLLTLASSGVSDTAEKKDPVSINASLGRAVLLLQPQAEEKGLALTYHTHPQELIVSGTEEGLDSIFTNLVGNAIKYTPPGGEVRIGVKNIGEEIQIEISDTGIGIPEEAIPNLFDEFYRAPNAKKSDEVGTGLGLTIVQNLVKAYGGNIQVDSNVGEGTTFTLTLSAA